MEFKAMEDEQSRLCLVESTYANQSEREKGTS